jgi:pyridoxamine 5'-phosphate oxidase family protein
MAFTDEEIAYLRSQPLARLATVSAGGQPDVVPVAFEFDGSVFWVGGAGPSVADTRKIRNVRGGNREVALVIDDMASLDPFVTPTVSWSWNLAGDPCGATWYETRRATHSQSTRSRS